MASFGNAPEFMEELLKKDPPIKGRRSLLPFNAKPLKPTSLTKLNPYTLRGVLFTQRHVPQFLNPETLLQPSWGNPEALHP